MAHHVFLSYSVKDKTVADAIVARLERDSIACWFAPRDVVPGADWGESIIDAIESSRMMVLIFSQNANSSPQIKREVERAVDKNVYVIPFRIEDIPPAGSLEYFISTPQWIDAFSPPLEPHLDKLAKTIKSVLNKPPLHCGEENMLMGNFDDDLSKNSNLRKPRRRAERALTGEPAGSKKRLREDPIDYPSFKETKEQLLNRLWRWIPRRLRLPLVVMIIIATTIVSTRSIWYPLFDSWIHKPLARFTVGGEIFLKENEPLVEGEVQLLDKNLKLISMGTTDRTGYVTFNISSKDKVAILRCRDRNGSPADLPLALSQIRKGKAFDVRIDTKHVDYREK